MNICILIQLYFRIVLNELPRVLRECREMIGDKNDALLQQTIKRLLTISDKERAASLLDIKEGNNPLLKLFELFESESTVFVETLGSRIFNC